VPPVALAVKVTGVPAVPVVGPVAVAASDSGATVTVCDAVPASGGVDVSLTDSVTVNVPLVV
jgi:hypothetical protein